jgi:hypothetical protein
LDNEVRFEIWYGFLGLDNWLGRWQGLSCLVFFWRLLGGDVEFWLLLLLEDGWVYLFVVLVCNGSLLQQKGKVSLVVAIENSNLTIFKHEILFQVQ